MHTGSDELFVALLRGINVGGKNLLPMKDLIRACQDLGCREVVTYIQSGNVVFRAEAELAARLPEALSGEIAKRFGLHVPVVVRSAESLGRALRQSPFPAADPRALHIAFLAAAPTPQAVAKLDPERSPGDSFAVVGQELYLCLPNGVGKSKLTNAYLDRVLGTVSTVRSWSTVLALAGRVGGVAG